MNLFSIRKQADRVLIPFVSTCALVPLSANVWTLVGALAGVACAVAFYRGLWLLGIFLFLVRGLLDHVDGYVARTRRQASVFGAVMDDLSDRWQLGVIYAGASLKLAEMYPHLIMVFAIGVTAALSNVIIKLSVYANTEQDQTVELGKVGHPIDNVGMFGSAEFMVWLGTPILLMALTGERLLGVAAIWAVALFAHLSLLQRMVFTWRRYRKAFTIDRPARGAELHSVPATAAAEPVPVAKAARQ